MHSAKNIVESNLRTENLSTIGSRSSSILIIEPFEQKHDVEILFTGHGSPNTIIMSLWRTKVLKIGSRTKITVRAALT